MPYSKRPDASDSYTSPTYDPIKTAQTIRADKAEAKKAAAEKGTSETSVKRLVIGFILALVVMIGLFAVAANGISEYGTPQPVETSLLHQSAEVVEKGIDKAPVVVEKGLDEAPGAIEKGLDSASEFLDGL